VVKFTPWPLYSQVKSPQYPLNRRPGGSQIHFGCGGKEKYPCSCQESNPGPPACSIVTILTELPQLLTINDLGKTPGKMTVGFLNYLIHLTMMIQHSEIIIRQQVGVGKEMVVAYFKVHPADCL
jgi:hypothetical protein